MIVSACIHRFLFFCKVPLRNAPAMSILLKLTPVIVPVLICTSLLEILKTFIHTDRQDNHRFVNRMPFSPDILNEINVMVVIVCCVVDFTNKSLDKRGAKHHRSRALFHANAVTNFINKCRVYEAMTVKNIDGNVFVSFFDAMRFPNTFFTGFFVGVFTFFFHQPTKLLMWNNRLIVRDNDCFRIPPVKAVT